MSRIKMAALVGLAVLGLAWVPSVSKANDFYGGPVYVNGGVVAQPFGWGGGWYGYGVPHRTTYFSNGAYYGAYPGFYGGFAPGYYQPQYYGYGYPAYYPNYYQGGNFATGSLATGSLY